MSTIEPLPTDSTPRPLVQHARRKQWGHGLVLWEREHKRACLFEDGEVRVFVEDYYDMLKPTETPRPALRMRLRARAESEGLIGRLPQRSGSSAPREPVPRVADQIALFDELFPKGFAGEAWQHAHRGRAGGRRIKRLRDPAVADARELLNRDELEMRFSQSRPDDIRTRLIRVLEATDLVTKSQLAPLRTRTFNDELAGAWLGLLHDMRIGDFTTEANVLVEMNKNDMGRVSWPLMTAARALVHPKDHLWVRPALLRKQIAASSRPWKLSTQPKDTAYQRCLELAMDVQMELTKAGRRPRDLFDVMDFIAVTRAPKEKTRLYEFMAKRLAPPGADASESSEDTDDGEISEDSPPVAN